MLRALVRPRRRPRPGAAALLVVATVTLGGCADDVEPRAPEESRSPSAFDAPTAPARTPVEEDVAGRSTDDLARPGSWPQGLDWTPVDGEVEDFTVVPDGSILLVVEMPVGADASAPQGFVRGWVTELEETAHAVETTGSWRRGSGDVVITAQHPERVIETQVSREAPDDPLRVQILLTPLT